MMDPELHKDMYAARMCDDMLEPEGEFNSNPSEEPWYFGSLSVRRGEGINGTTYLKVYDVDGRLCESINPRVMLTMYQCPGRKLAEKLREINERELAKL